MTGLDAERRIHQLEEQLRTVRDEVLEEAAGTVELRAREVGKAECCGCGIGSPPACCGDPVYMIADITAAAAIRKLKGKPA